MKRLFFLILLATMAGACTKQPNTNLNDLYDHLAQNNAAPYSIEVDALGDAVMVWDTDTEDQGATYLNVKKLLTEQFLQAPTEYEYINNCSHLRQKEVWAIGNRLIELQEDTTRQIMLRISVKI
jgi:hypothetical protein